MSTQLEIIAVENYCNSNNIEKEFLNELYTIGLIKIVQINNAANLYIEELGKIEKYTRLHYELNVNLEGIDIISALLEKIETLQHDSLDLKERLSIYE